MPSACKAALGSGPIEFRCCYNSFSRVVAVLAFDIIQLGIEVMRA
jgi:hypothetical protein